MAYNPTLYNSIPNGQVAYPSMQQMPNMAVMQGATSPMYPTMTPPPLSLSAAYTQGEIGARSFPVATGNTVILLDSDTIDTDNPIIYVKTTGYDGKPQMMKKISGVVSYPNEQGLFSSPISESSAPQIDLTEYVMKTDLSGLQEELKGITERLNGLDSTIDGLNENITSIDNRFSNMFNAVNCNNNSNNSNGNNNNHNKNNNNRKGNNN